MWQETQYLSVEVYSETVFSENKKRAQIKIPIPANPNFDLVPVNALLHFMLKNQSIVYFLCFNEECKGGKKLRSCPAAHSFLISNSLVRSFTAPHQSVTVY